MQSKKTRLKGKGWFVNDYNIIYVSGTINKKSKRVSTGMEATTKNLTYIKYKNNARDELVARTSIKKTIATDFETFGLAAIVAGAKKKKNDGTYTRKGRGATSQENALSAFQKHLLPFFKNIALEDIDAWTVEAWQDEKLEDYATDSVSKWKNYLSQIMDVAVKYELVGTNKIDLADSIEIVHKKTAGFTVEEARRIMTNSKGFMKVLLHIAFNTGARVGELKGMKVGDVDLEHKCIYIKRAVAGNIITFSSSTKNHNRIVYFSDYTKTLIEEYIKDKKQDDWLFVSTRGTFFKSTSTLEKYHFQPLLKKLKITGTLGKTRKTFASVAKSYAMNENARQRAMGHKEGSSITDKHYTFPTMTSVQAQAGQAALAPVNDVLFNVNRREG